MNALGTLRAPFIEGNRRIARSVATLVVVVLVILAGIAALLLLNGVERQLDDIIVTYQTRLEARELAFSMVEAESSQRGYLLTGDQAFLVPYQLAMANVEERLSELAELAEGDPVRQAAVAQIASEAARRRAELDASVRLTTAGREEQAQLLMETGAGTRLMADLRDAIGVVLTEQDSRLAERNEAIAATRLSLVVAILVALAGAALLAAILMGRIQHQVRVLASARTRLEDENAILEEKVAARTAELEEARSHAERERERVEVLLRESNHRIGNSLATVSSLLQLQILRTRSPQARDALEAARDRVHAVASGHRRLRLGDDLETADIAEFLATVAEDIRDTKSDMGQVSLSHDFTSFRVSARDATTIGIILGELITNAYKHAFPDGRAGHIITCLDLDEEGVPVLSVCDDGVGMPSGPSEPDHAGEGGLGSLVVSQLARQFGGELEQRPGPDGRGVNSLLRLPQLIIET